MTLREVRIAALVLACAAVSGAADVTFSKDIAPVFFKHCATCHHPNDIAPMSLLTYHDARPWAKAIRDAVVSKQMPPWYADASTGPFANDPRLSPAEIQLITDWVDQGAKEGNAAETPRAPVFADGWRIGKPDLIIPIPAEYTIEPNATDDYKTFISTVEIKQDLWIKAIELKPGNRRVVHHAHVFVIPPDQPTGPSPTLLAKYAYREDPLGPLHMRADAPVIDDACRDLGQGGLPDMPPHGNSTTLTTFVPGRAPETYPEGYARLIPAGSKIGFQIHYAPGTKQVEKDLTSVGLIFAKASPKTVFRRLDLETYLFKIPAGEPNHEVTLCYNFPEDVRLLTITPHMHLRGKDMRWELVRPDAVKETILSVPRYDFNWQIEYKFAKPVTAPAGSRLIVTAHFDNSANNRVNPDPTRTVRWGEPTTDEMFGTWIAYELAKEPSK